MGNLGARAFGLEKAPLTLDDSSSNIDPDRECYKRRALGEVL